MGESWHNNHHAFPSSAKLGLFPGQIDLGWWLIKTFEALGLAWQIKTPADLSAPARDCGDCHRPTAAIAGAPRARKAVAMTSPFGFRGRIGRLPYALWSAAFFFSQHLVALAHVQVQGVHAAARLVVRLRAAAGAGRRRPTAEPVPACRVSRYLLIVAWALAALAYQRAADADINEWIAAAAIAPFIQIAVIAYLSVPAMRSTRCLRRAATGEPGHARSPVIAYGVIACVGVTIVGGRPQHAAVQRLRLRPVRLLAVRHRGDHRVTSPICKATSAQGAPTCCWPSPPRSARSASSRSRSKASSASS